MNHSYAHVVINFLMCACVFQEHQGEALSDSWGWNGEVVWNQKHGVHDWWGLQSKGRERASPIPTLAGLQIVIHFIIPLPSLTVFFSFPLSLSLLLPLLSLHFLHTLFLHSSLTLYLPCPPRTFPSSLIPSPSKALHGHFSNTVDNICWLAPEVLAQDLSGYSYQSDIYSIGIAALELATGEAPFAGLPITEVALSPGPTQILSRSRGEKSIFPIFLHGCEIKSG